MGTASLLSSNIISRVILLAKILVLDGVACGWSVFAQSVVLVGGGVVLFVFEDSCIDGIYGLLGSTIHAQLYLKRSKVVEQQVGVTSGVLIVLMLWEFWNSNGL